MTKKTLGVLFSVIAFAITAIVVTGIPVPRSEAAGSSSDFVMDKSKLIKYAGTANVVSIPNTVKIIGAEAFAENSELTGVTIPKSVEKIEYGAFSDCTALRRIDIPNSVKQIGTAAFNNCKSLKIVNLGKSVSDIGSGAFVGCEALKEIRVSRENKYFKCDGGVLYDKEKTKIYQMLAGRADKKYSFPTTVTDIAEYAFWGCNNLEKVTVSNNLEKIPEYAFSNCTSLKEIMIPYSVKSIQMKAFADCVNLGEVTIPASVNYIHVTAFDGCVNLKIKADSSTVAAQYAKDILPEIQKNAGKKNPTEEDKNGTQKDTSNNTNSDADNSNDINKGKEDSGEEGNLLGKGVVVGNSAIVLMDSGKASVVSGGMMNQTDDESSADSSKTANHEIAESAFYRDSGLYQYVIPADTKKINKFAFARSGLWSIEIPKGVSEIGYAAFYHCDQLQDVMIPSTVKKIGTKAFEKTPWLNNWKEQETENDFLIVGDGILLAYKGKAEAVAIPDEVKVIGTEVFAGHTEIKKVKIPKTVTDIDSQAFANCSNLESIEGGSKVKNIVIDAFTGCPVTLANTKVEPK